MRVKGFAALCRQEIIRRAADEVARNPEHLSLESELLLRSALTSLRDPRELQEGALGLLLYAVFLRKRGFGQAAAALRRVVSSLEPALNAALFRTDGFSPAFAAARS